MERFSKFYIKYIVKSSVVFYTVIAVFIFVFIFISLTIKVDRVTMYPASFSNDRVIINDILKTPVDHIYMYKTQNEKVYFLPAFGMEEIEQYTVIYINTEGNDDIHTISGIVSVDIVTDKYSLLELIFIKAGQKDVE